MAFGARNEQEVRGIVKPRTDKRDYRRIVLHNALEVLLISYPETDKVLLVIQKVLKASRIFLVYAAATVFLVPFLERKGNFLRGIGCGRVNKQNPVSLGERSSLLQACTSTFEKMVWTYKPKM
ncbi:uncharacterized protein [Coffea arabica]|uniref:Uncharacterized protein isoform X3 n=1 Tax=Coffea arabica TaxID=13443 RepID=A0ABM4W8G7_COFAR